MKVKTKWGRCKVCWDGNTMDRGRKNVKNSVVGGGGKAKE